MINWQYFPKSKKLPEHLEIVIKIFKNNDSKINSENHQLNSDGVLAIIRKELSDNCYKVESSKKSAGKIKVPVLFGKNGKLEKSFEADAYSKKHKTVIEVEAGRGVTNYQFLKDLFQACMMYDVEILVIAIRNLYRSSRDFEKVANFFETLYSNNRLQLPLKGILVVGY